MNEFIEQFLLEARELVEQAANDLLALEKAPHDGDLLDSTFRAFHTLKGGAGIVDFVAMQNAVHAAEDVLAAVRAGTRTITANLIGDCLACLDQVGRWLDAIESSGEIPRNADTEASAITARLTSTAGAAAEISATIGRSDIPPISSANSVQAGLQLDVVVIQLLQMQRSLLDGQHLPEAAGRIGSAGRTAANVLRSAGRTEEAQQLDWATDRALAENDVSALRNAMRAALDHDQAPVSVDAAAQAHPETNRPDSTARTLRVAASRIDALVNLTGELTVAKNAIGHIVSLPQSDPTAATALKERHASLDRLVSQLQRIVLALRVLPLRHVFQRFPRILREMALNLGKPANLIIEGDDTEADKAIVETLFEPLLHVLRNAMDHGIEDEPSRAASGKPAGASITLRARRQGEYVIVELQDDGRGIDPAKIRQVALQRGVMNDETLATLNAAELIDLIFAPGFSTATEVTDLSGRGVGMDVVRSTIERLGGQVTIQSSLGQGTAVRFALPFSVMMTRVMTVEAGGQMFGIALDAMVETLRVPAEQIVGVGQAKAFVWRNRTIALIRLAEALDGQDAPAAASEAIIVIARISGQFGALHVDRLGERMEVMLKPLDGLLSNTPGIAGTTLLGDGRVLLVLDLAELLQ